MCGSHGNCAAPTTTPCCAVVRRMGVKASWLVLCTPMLAAALGSWQLARGGANWHSSAERVCSRCQPSYMRHCSWSDSRITHPPGPGTTSRVQHYQYRTSVPHIRCLLEPHHAVTGVLQSSSSQIVLLQLQPVRHIYTAAQSPRQCTKALLCIGPIALPLSCAAMQSRLCTCCTGATAGPCQLPHGCPAQQACMFASCAGFAQSCELTCYRTRGTRGTTTSAISFSHPTSGAIPPVPSSPAKQPAPSPQGFREHSSLAHSHTQLVVQLVQLGQDLPAAAAFSKTAERLTTDNH